MSTLRTTVRRISSQERGFTLMELVIAMALGTVVSLAGLGFLEFATSDVSRINERVHVDQTARVALERIMLRLHTACLVTSVAPIRTGSNENEMKFISAAGGEAALSKLQLHEIVFTKPSGSKKGTLVENIYEPTKSSELYEFGKSREYTFSAKPVSTVKLLTGVKNSERSGETLPLFRYYRYYRSTDPLPTGYTATPYQLLYPTPLASSSLEKAEEAESVVKVEVHFTAVPEGVEPATFEHDRAIPLEDSAVFRNATASETTPNGPCQPAN
ncbi:MAG TPA: prepilin-type N-terminal cleavage/methylation domain-containing protein [Solirubrobacteraceae bacterium]|nr:prepilin-type N-terminal cleavage/methylation domain-containing protein [Solirubrobacteraceae bacterium]